ncbi:hypothetical protein C8J55DRAFT_151656 [Lentinula edodes]|uniref:Uncharacterized protein n=1 Tax=Lentinula lateritia TaxID=40482 RepID=A0A9W9A1W1_9AGAR|nr:hypothetical protein C8J55DRAFT_151656 [Lentinula edodes]
MHSKNCVHIMYVPTYIRTDISQSSSAFLSWNAVCAIPRPESKRKRHQKAPRGTAIKTYNRSTTRRIRYRLMMVQEKMEVCPTGTSN